MNKDYEMFKENVVAYFEEKLPKNTEISFQLINQNNGSKREGMVIHIPGRDISSVFYLEKAFADYENGQLLDDILSELKSSVERVSVDFNTDYLLSYAAVKPLLAVKLVNFENNQEMLKNVPYVRFFDLAAVPYILLPEDAVYGKTATIQIKKHHLSIWGVTAEEVWNDAIGNCENILPSSLATVVDYIGLILEKENEDFPLYVLTNSKHQFGASCLLYEGMPEKILEKMGGDFYIIPSSIHEVLLLPMKPDTDPGVLRNMVSDVNGDLKIIDKEDILSNQVYCYRKGIGYSIAE